MQRTLATVSKVTLSVIYDQLTDYAPNDFDGHTSVRRFRPATSLLPYQKHPNKVSNVDHLCSLIATLACADGTTQDQDRLKGIFIDRVLVATGDVAGTRRFSERPSRFTRRHANSLHGIARQFIKRIVLLIVHV